MKSLINGKIIEGNSKIRVIVIDQQGCEKGWKRSGSGKEGETEPVCRSDRAHREFDCSRLQHPGHHHG